MIEKFRGLKMETSRNKKAGGWKKHLLQSGVPLEFEVANVLSSMGMAVDADFGFSQEHGAFESDRSVDIHATWYKSSKRGVAFSVEILVECKHRSPEKTLVLFPDPNTEYSPISVGGTINIVDFHAPIHVSSKAITEFERSFPNVYKGVEIFDHGETSSEFRHGIEQLRSAIPYLLSREIAFGLGGHVEEVHPIFMTKVLVTNSNIVMIKPNISVKEIHNVKNLEEISIDINSAILYSDYGPGFDRHFVKSIDINDRVFEILQTRIEELEQYGINREYSPHPIRFMKDLSAGSRYHVREFCTQFFIVRTEYLHEFTSGVISACSAAYRAAPKPRRKSRAS